jgi:hypothetical protein
LIAGGQYLLLLKRLVQDLMRFFDKKVLSGLFDRLFIFQNIKRSIL